MHSISVSYNQLTKHFILGTICSDGQKNTIISKTYGHIEITDEGYVCPRNCGKVYKHSNSLYVHLKHECGREKQYLCSYCNKSFARKLKWKMHMGMVHRHIVEWEKSKKIPPFNLIVIFTYIHGRDVAIVIIYY